jgi:hypothetical protein
MLIGEGSIILRLMVSCLCITFMLQMIVPAGPVSTERSRSKAYSAALRLVIRLGSGTTQYSWII